jgi:hypothetical protein
MESKLLNTTVDYQTNDTAVLTIGELTFPIKLDIGNKNSLDEQIFSQVKKYNKQLHVQINNLDKTKKYLIYQTDGSIVDDKDAIQKAENINIPKKTYTISAKKLKKVNICLLILIVLVTLSIYSIPKFIEKVNGGHFYKTNSNTNTLNTATDSTTKITPTTIKTVTDTKKMSKKSKSKKKTTKTFTYKQNYQKYLFNKPHTKIKRYAIY